MYPTHTHQAPIHASNRYYQRELCQWQLISQCTAASVWGGMTISSPRTSSQPAPSAAADHHPESPSAAGQHEASNSTPSSNVPQWSDSLQSVLDHPPASLPQRLILTSLLFTTIFGVWAWFGKMQEVSHAQGHLVPEGQVYKVQPVVQGEVTQIYLEEGQTVEAGQIIARLDDRTAAAEAERLQQNLSDQELQLVQLQALIDQTQIEAGTRQAITDADLQAQAAAIAQAQTDAATSQTLLTHLKAEANAHRTRLERLHPLVEQGALAKDYLFEVEQAIRDREQAIIRHEGQYQQSQTQAQQLQAELDQRTAEGERSHLELQRQLQQLEMKAAELQAKIAETKILLREAQANLDSTVLRVPVDGVIFSLNLQNEGELAQSGQVVAEVAPTTAPLVLSAALPSREAGLVEVGMVAQIKLDAFPYQDYGIITGKVTSISPDAKSHETMGTVYELEIALDQDSISHENQDVQLRAGQTANAEIVIRQRRIIDVIFEPIRQLRQDSFSL